MTENTAGTSSVWYEIEVQLYHETKWSKTTAIGGDKEDGFSTPQKAEAFINKMKADGDILYQDAQWRIVKCERSILTPATI